MSQTIVTKFFNTRKRHTASTNLKKTIINDGISISSKNSNSKNQDVESEIVQTNKSKVVSLGTKIEACKKTKTTSVAKTEQVRRTDNEPIGKLDSSYSAKKVATKSNAVVKSTIKSNLEGQLLLSSKKEPKSKGTKKSVAKKKGEAKKGKTQNSITKFYTPSSTASDVSTEIPTIIEPSKIDSTQCLNVDQLENKIEKANDISNEVGAKELQKTSVLSGEVKSPKRKLPPPKEVTPSKKPALLDNDGKVSHLQITPSKDGVSSARKRLDMNSLSKMSLPSHSPKVVTPSKSPKLGKLDNMIEQSRTKLILSPKVDQLRKSLSSFNEKALKVQGRVSNPFKVTCITKSGLSPDKKQAVVSSKSTCIELSYLKEPALPQELLLPKHFKMLSVMFKSLDQVVKMLNNRKEVALFDKVKQGVQKILNSSFSKMHLGQIMTVYPDAYDIKIGKSSYIMKTADSPEYPYVLTPILQKDKDAKWQLMTPQCLITRMNIFNENLLSIVKDHHQKFLTTINFVSKTENFERWHPKFVTRLDSIPKIQPTSLPEPKESKTSTAKDILEKVKNFRIRNKKIENALESVVGSNSDETKANVNVSTSKPPSKNEVKGLCPQLLAKIRAKESQKALETMTQSASEKEILAMKERLPKMIKIIWHYFIGEQKKVILLGAIIEKIIDSMDSHITIDAVKRHLGLIQSQYPGWLLYIELPKGTFVRIDKTRNISEMVDV